MQTDTRHTTVEDFAVAWERVRSFASRKEKDEVTAMGRTTGSIAFGCEVEGTGAVNVIAATGVGNGNDGSAGA